MIYWKILENRDLLRDCAVSIEIRISLDGM